MRTRPSIKELKGTLPSHKKKAAAYRLWLHYGTRPMSYVLAWVLARMGVSANAATAMSLALGVAGCVLLSMGQYWTSVLGAAVAVAYLVADAADGNLARVSGTTTRWGAYFDGLVNLIVETLIPIAVGVGLYRVSGQGIYLALGFTVVTLRLATNVAGFWHLTIFGGKPWAFVEEVGETGFLYWVGKNLICAATLLLLVSATTRMLPFFLGLYVLVFAGGLGVVVIRSIKIARRTE